MPIIDHAKFDLAAMTAVYQLDQETGCLGLMLYPSECRDLVVERRELLNGVPEIDVLAKGKPFRAWNVESLLQLKKVGDAYPAGFGQSCTMRNSDSVTNCKFTRQEVRTNGPVTEIVSHFTGKDGDTAEHHLSHTAGDLALESWTVYHNTSQAPVTLEMLASFSLSGITPFAADDAPDRLRIHRFRSFWSAEGRLDSQTAEELNLERSWTGWGMRSERFGTTGSMPVKSWFPAVLVEDMEAGVMWGAMVAWSGSWQMEVYRRDDRMSLSGGWADREFGHWTKTLKPGESLTTPRAILTTGRGDVDDLAQRWLTVMERAVEAAPAVEADLPLIFNEWCTSWGTPTHDNLVALADRVRELPIKYLVIDAGWYSPMKNAVEGGGHGDWVANSESFPQGLAATARAIRERGLIPGLWFEMETLSGRSQAWKNHPEHVLHRDGRPLETGQRRFWDLRDPWCRQYLTEKVIDQLEQAGMGYVKVDYNDTIGLGADGDESLGEALRKHINGVHDFFRLMRQRLPDLVIENCSSGGHRLEPMMMSLCSQASFSDAHETQDIPILAANLHRLIPPRQSQIWAVLHAGHDDRRLVYLLAGGFLGRLCLSGPVTELSPEQWALVKRGCLLYRQAAPVIKQGKSFRYGPTITSYRHPQGWQAMLRVGQGEAQGKALVVAHTFAQPGVPTIALDLPEEMDGAWRVADKYHANKRPPMVRGRRLLVPMDGDYCGAVVLLKREG